MTTALRLPAYHLSSAPTSSCPSPSAPLLTSVLTSKYCLAPAAFPLASVLLILIPSPPRPMLSARRLSSPVRRSRASRIRKAGCSWILLSSLDLPPAAVAVAVAASQAFQAISPELGLTLSDRSPPPVEVEAGSTLMVDPVGSAGLIRIGTSLRHLG